VVDVVGHIRCDHRVIVRDHVGECGVHLSPLLVQSRDSQTKVGMAFLLVAADLDELDDEADEFGDVADRRVVYENGWRS
jgi:hypothetical protein